MIFITQSNNNSFKTIIEPSFSEIAVIFASVVSYFIAALIGILLLIIMFKLIKYLNLKIKLMSKELNQ